MNVRHRLAQDLQDALFAHPQAGPIPVRASLVEAVIAALRFPVTQAEIDRFLAWRLPEDFRPDAGISFKRDFNEHTSRPMKHQPMGTNLLNADQAKTMLEHIMEQPSATTAR